MSKNKMLKGGLIGAGVGLLAGILLAPKSGRETRKEIKRVTKQTLSATEHELKDLYKELGNLTDSAAAQVKKAGKAANSELHELMTAGEKLRESLRQLISSVHEGDADEQEVAKALQEGRQAAKRLAKKVMARGKK